jgi:NAD-dependent DNA ligase
VMRPVNVGGVTITHASLHNSDEIARLGLKIGDTVIIQRAGDVIPQITKVLTELRTGREKVFKMPTRCPVDGSPVTREGAIERCSSKMCAAQHRESLYHFVSRAAFNIEPTKLRQKNVLRCHDFYMRLGSCMWGRRLRHCLRRILSLAQLPQSPLKIS